MKKFIQDFKDFAFKGNIIDMAVGVIIGGAFGKIVTALVENIISPLIGLALTKAGADSLATWGIKVGDTGVVIALGAFLQAVIDFFIIALCIFVVLRLIMTAKKKVEDLKKKDEEEAAEEKADTELSVLLEIKELLEQQKK